MAFEGKQEVQAFVASGDLSGMQYRVVEMIAGAQQRIGHALANQGFGILLNKPRSLEHASVMTRGQGKVRAGAAMTVGSLVVSAASGWAIAATGATAAIASGSVLTPQVILGRALSAAASGSLFSIEFDPQVTLVVSA